MTTNEIISLRLHNQFLSHQPFTKPEDVVRWMGVVQAQDFEGAKWGVAQRLQGVSKEEMDAVFNNGEILRTHVVRPTWHFVSPTDIRWLLALSAPRINAACITAYRQLELNDKIFKSSNAVIEKELQKGVPLDRNELKAALEQKKINTSDIRLSYFLMRAELDALICSGPKRDKQFTYMLLDVRAPKAVKKNRDEALAILCERYFMSHGPATARDYGWWAGLTGAEVKRSMEMLGTKLNFIEVKGIKYAFILSSVKQVKKVSRLHLLPPYDEYTVGYSDRQIILDPSFNMQTGNGIFKPVIINKGKIIGTWKKQMDKGKPGVETDLFAPSQTEAERHLRSTIGHYLKYLTG